MLINGLSFIKKMTIWLFLLIVKKMTRLLIKLTISLFWNYMAIKFVSNIISNDDDCNTLYSINDFLKDRSLGLTSLGLYMNYKFIDLTEYIYEENIKKKKKKKKINL